MKKEIEYINLSPKILEQAYTLLNGNNDLEELAIAIKEAINNNSTLVISQDTSDKKDATINLQKIIKASELTIYVDEHKVIKNGDEINLTPKEFDILYFLCRNKGIVFTKEQIYKAIWKDEYLLDDGTIMSFIRKLRKKIETNPDAPIYIQTIWGIGYKFNEKL